MKFKELYIANSGWVASEMLQIVDMPTNETIGNFTASKANEIYGDYIVDMFSGQTVYLNINI